MRITFSDNIRGKRKKRTAISTFSIFVHTKQQYVVLYSSWEQQNEREDSESCVYGETLYLIGSSSEKNVEIRVWLYSQTYDHSKLLRLMWSEESFLLKSCRVQWRVLLKQETLKCVAEITKRRAPYNNIFINILCSSIFSSYILFLL